MCISCNYTFVYLVEYSSISTIYKVMTQLKTMKTYHLSLPLCGAVMIWETNNFLGHVAQPLRLVEIVCNSAKGSCFYLEWYIIWSCFESYYIIHCHVNARQLGDPQWSPNDWFSNTFSSTILIKPNTRFFWSLCNYTVRVKNK